MSVPTMKYGIPLVELGIPAYTPANMINKAGTAYCERIQKENILIKKKMLDIRIEDDASSLFSLRDIGSPLIFEHSFFEGDNFMVREAVAKKILRINQALKTQRKTLVIRSAWRSFTHQKELRELRHERLAHLHPEKSAVEIASIISHFIPTEKHSMHTTGGAVDALIYDDKEKSVLDFGTNSGFKINLSDKCYPLHPSISMEAKKNRKLLMQLFEQEGFVADTKEFWHFDFGNVAWAAAKNLNKAKYGLIFT